MFWFSIFSKFGLFQWADIGFLDIGRFVAVIFQ